MRTPTDLPRRPRRVPRARPALILTVVVLVVLFISIGKIAGFYTDYLWFQQLGFTDVFRGLLWAKISLAVFFAVVLFALIFVNLLVADRFAPRFALLGPDDELVQRYREAVGRHRAKVRVAVAVFFALILGVGQSSQWNSWILFRHATSFHISDPQFHKDVGFYVFRLPFYQFLVSWSFAAVIITTFLTAVFYYLNGGIRLQVPSNRVTPQVKAHLSVLFGLMALIKAAGYFLNQYALVLSTNGYVNGAGYTDVHARLPALRLLMFIMVLAFFLLLYNIRQRGWTLPVLAIGLWMLVAVAVGGIYPLIVQQITVNPQQNKKENPYIKRNISATNQALGIDKVAVSAFPYNGTNSALSTADLIANAQTIRNIRLWDPAPGLTLQTYQQIQQIKQYYSLPSLGIDRYQLDGRLTQTILSTRELNQSGLPQNTWVNQHLVFTHGYGVALAPSNAVTTDGRPVFAIKDVPPAIPTGAPANTPTITQPSLYFGLRATTFSIVDTKQVELDYQRPDGTNVSSQYSGAGGVVLSSFLRRAAFAARFSDWNVLISGQITTHSRVLYIRDVPGRVHKVAPFLRLDADPYSVILPNGHVVWIQDAYTTSNKYPYAQTANVARLADNSGLKTDFNYVRNSVKAVVDAYDGHTTLYVQDPNDPIIRTYAKAFPKLFRPASEMPEGMPAHLRYPEDQFQVQTTMYGRYHQLDAQAFYSSANAWNVAQDPGTGNVARQLSQTVQTTPSGQPIAGTAAFPRQAPYYLVSRLPGEVKEEFQMLQPFVPQSADDSLKNLTAFMVAKSGDVASDYGQLVVYQMPTGINVPGPAQIDSLIKQNTAVSASISLLNTQGSEADFGNVLGIPIGDALIYLRPLYVKSTTTNQPIPQLKKVILVYGTQVAYEDTLQGALNDLFPGLPNLTQEQGATTPGGTTPPSGTTPPTGTPPSGTTATVQDLLKQAQADFAAADAALKNGDLATYQAKITSASMLIDQAYAQLAGTSTTSPTSSSTTSPTASTTVGGQSGPTTSVQPASTSPPSSA